MLFTEQNDIYNVMWINFQTVKTLRSYITHFLGGWNEFYPLGNISVERNDSFHYILGKKKSDVENKLKQPHLYEQLLKNL